MTQPRAALVLAVLVLTATPFVGAAPLPPVDVGPADAALAEAVRAAEAAVAEAERQLAGAKAVADQLRGQAEGAADDASAVARQAQEEALLLAEGHAAAAERALQEALEQLEAMRAAAAAEACRTYRHGPGEGDVVVWTSCNMGPGSGLDADLLDGVGAEAFFGRIDAEAGARVAGDSVLRERLDALDIDLEGRAWATVLARDGSGSGLDADTLDGLDGARFVRYAPGGAVGIGTPAPAAMLDVTMRSPHASLVVRDGDTSGSCARGEHAWRDAAGAGVGLVGPDGCGVFSLWTYQPRDLRFGTGNQEQVRITADGKLGLGTRAPTEKVEVFQDADAPLRLEIHNPNAGADAHGQVWFSNDAGDGRGYVGLFSKAYVLEEYRNRLVVTGRSGSDLLLGAEGKGSIVVATHADAPGNQERMRITNAGHVGIGTPEPKARLHVVGDSRDLLSVQYRNGGVGSEAGITFGTTPIHLSAGIFVQDADQYNGHLIFRTDNDGTFASHLQERMRITKDGNVGLGTEAPAARLHVSGSSVVARFANPAPGGYTAVTVGQDDRGNGGAFQHISAGWRGNDGSPVELARGNNFEIFNQHPTGNLTFHTANSIVPKVSITSGGHVGIGTIAPQSALEVNGYLQLARTAGAPPAADCDSASERGRMKVDGAAGLLYLCMDSGWVAK